MGRYEDYRQRGSGERGPQGIANKIIATRKYPGNASLAFLIVEGETDRRFYMRFIDKNQCQITNAFNKSAALQVLSILEKELFSGSLAIVDADFDVLTGKLPTSQNVLLTDTHDLETMIIQSPAFEKVLDEFGSAEKIGKITPTRSNLRCLKRIYAWLSRTSIFMKHDCMHPCKSGRR